ncbi:MAG: putative lipid II flippase FtsW [Treponema sp.]|nr:putative lipid II flippase FtsW [Treponema sp.]
MGYHFDGGLAVPRRNHLLQGSVFLLTGLGLVTLYSASYAYARRFFDNGLYFTVRQGLMAVAGLALFALASKAPLDWLRRAVGPLVIGTMFLCALTFVPGVGMLKNGAARWIRIGSWSYQPSELVKLCLPIYLAHIFAKKEDDEHSFVHTVLPPVLITALFFVLIYLQNNFSTAIFIALNALVIFFFAGVKPSFFISAIAMLLPLSSLLILTREHRLTRLMSFIWPDWEPQRAGYQVHSSILSISSGGFWGRGLGQGTRKIASVPEIQSDFIFSSYAEEAGFFGVLLFMLLFGLFAFQGYRSSLKQEDSFARLLGLGLVTMITSQALLNVAVTAGALPATGIPLPFFSAGGSSLATTLLAAGLVVNATGPHGSERGGV